MYLPNVAPHSADFRAHRRGERGSAAARLVFFILFVIVALYVGFKVVPPYISNYELEDWMRTQAPFFVVNHMSNDAVMDSIVKQMQTHDIIATKDNVKIIANSPTQVHIIVNYDVPVDMGFYKTTLHFEPTIDSQSLVQ
jgi:hypothetical protein